MIASNVTCWQDLHDLRGGDYWLRQINEAIKHHDKFLLVCSEASLQRHWVVEEIVTAIAQEKALGRQKLFPIRIDDYLFSEELTALAREKVTCGAWTLDWVRYIRAYQAPDFRKWKRHDAYQTAFQNLLRDLKDPAKR